MKKVVCCKIKIQEIIFILFMIIIFLILVKSAIQSQKKSIEACIKGGFPPDVCHRIHS